jgi:hypothetical protein
MAENVFKNMIETVKTSRHWEITNSVKITIYLRRVVKNSSYCTVNIIKCTSTLFKIKH